MKKKKITILCILESHSDENQIETLNNRYRPIYKFTHTYDRENNQTKGIVIVKNNSLIPNDLLNIKDIIPR